MRNLHFAQSPDHIIRRICIEHNGFSINAKCLCRNSVVSSTQISNCALPQRGKEFPYIFYYKEKLNSRPAVD